MIRQYLGKQRRILRGALNSLRRIGHNYRDDEWWDQSFYTEGVSDRQTISPHMHALRAHPIGKRKTENGKTVPKTVPGTYYLMLENGARHILFDVMMIKGGQ